MLVAQTHANVKIGAAYTGLLTGRTGKTHQDVEDLAIMRAMPGMTVLAPGDATECIAMVRWASAMSGPVYLRLARDAGPDLVDPDYAFVPGRVLVVREGTDVLIVSTGMQTARCLDAAALLEADGISAGVLHVPSLKPVDGAAIAAAAGRVPLVVSVEEHSVFGGLGGLVAEIVGALAPRRVVRIGIEDTWGESASNAFLLDRHGLSPERVAERVDPRGPSPRRARRCLDGRGFMTTTSRGDGMTTFAIKDPTSIGVAFLGVGRIGVTHLMTLAGIPNARLVVVADLDPVEAEAGRALGHANRATTDALDAINDPEVEAVVIVTPTSTHATLIEAALRAGKAIWSEKPIALDLAETERVVALWRETGIPVQMGFMRRFDPGYVRAKELIDAGELGRIEQFRAYSRDTYLPPAKFIRDSGGSFLDMSVHDFDLARFLVGEVEEVSAWGSNLIDQRFEDGGDVDTAVTMLRFENGALGVVEMSRRSAWGYDIRTEVAGALGKVVVEAPHKTTLTLSRRFGYEGDHYENFPDRFEVAYRLEFDAFFRTLAEGGTPVAGAGRCARDPPARAGRQAQLARGTSRPRGRDQRMTEAVVRHVRPAAGATGTRIDVTPASVGWRYLSFRVVALGAGETMDADAAGRGAGRGAPRRFRSLPVRRRRPPGLAARRVHGQAARPVRAAGDGLRDRRRRRVRGGDRVGAGHGTLSRRACTGPTSCRASCGAAPTPAVA